MPRLARENRKIQRRTTCPTCGREVGQTPCFWNRQASGWKLARHMDSNSRWCPASGIKIEGEQ